MAFIYYRFDTGSLAQINSVNQTYYCWGGSGAIYAGAIWTDAAAYDRCTVQESYIYYAYTEAIAYNYHSVTTSLSSGIGYYQDCTETENHQYKWRADFWSDTGAGWDKAAAEFNN